MLFVSLLLMLAGLVIYAVNADCDIGVYGLGLVTRNDQVGYFLCFKTFFLPVFWWWRERHTHKDIPKVEGPRTRVTML